MANNGKKRMLLSVSYISFIGQFSKGNDRKCAEGLDRWNGSSFAQKPQRYVHQSYTSQVLTLNIDLLLWHTQLNLCTVFFNEKKNGRVQKIFDIEN